MNSYLNKKQSGYIVFLKQIKENELISISYDKEKEIYEFNHLKDDIIIFHKLFTEFDKMKVNDNIFVLENKNENFTIVYNSDDSNYFGLEDFTVVDNNIIKDKNEESYLLGTLKVNCNETLDEVMFLLNLKTMQTNGFYSKLQDRYIKVKTNDGTAIDKIYEVLLIETIVDDIYRYVETLDKERSQKEKEKFKVIMKTLLDNEKKK